MDIETLTNHISRLGKDYFEISCKIVLRDVFGLLAINVDGTNDGGTDFTSFSRSGQRANTAYQITTQKTDIVNKAYRDADKAIKKLGVERFYFLTTINLSETDTRKIEVQISKELNIPSTCLGARNIAGLLLDENLLNTFLDETNYPLPRSPKSQLEYREMALHSYTLFSNDASKLKLGIYEDTILFILSENGALSEGDIIEKTLSFLSLGLEKEESLKRRVGALFGNGLIKKNSAGAIELTQKTSDDLSARKQIYEIELSSLTSAQVELMRNEFDTDWSGEDSKKVALWIANTFIADQISNLKEVKASIVSNPLFEIEENGYDKLKAFLMNEKKIKNDKSEEIIHKLLENASDHPLINKLSRASVYLALEGCNPISSAKALGANRWADFSILLEPTVAIPFVCSQLFKGKVNRFFDSAIKAVSQAQRLDIKLFIPHFYINECAGHLLQARRYLGLNLENEEFAFSSNAFVANYCALKHQGINLPESFLEYLATFSPSIRTERVEIKDWVKSLMTDIQSILNRAGVEYIDTPFFKDSDCIEFEKEYMYCLDSYSIKKKSHLIKHDTWALQFTNDKIKLNNEHWIVLTYDRSMIAVSKNEIFKGWIANPPKFLSFSEITKPLPETKLTSLMHSVATFSERTLSAGARIIDKVVNYASDKMQNWEFRQEVESFKNEMIQDINLDESDYEVKIDQKTDEFLKKHGIDKTENSEEDAYI